MSKKATTNYPVNDLIAERWSPRAFKNEALTEEQILSLFEAARWAASAFNEQPWHFVYATQDDKAAYDKILDCMVEFNQNWAKNAPLLILTAIRKNFTKTGDSNPIALHDLGLAIGNLTTQATSMGLYVHNMTGFDAGKAQQLFEIPSDYQVATLIAAGYKTQSSILPDDLKQAEEAARERKALSTIAFRGEWKA